MKSARRLPQSVVSWYVVSPKPATTSWAARISGLGVPVEVSKGSTPAPPALGARLGVPVEVSKVSTPATPGVAASAAANSELYERLLVIRIRRLPGAAWEAD